MTHKMVYSFYLPVYNEYINIKANTLSDLFRYIAEMRANHPEGPIITLGKLRNVPAKIADML